MLIYCKRKLMSKCEDNEVWSLFQVRDGFETCMSQILPWDMNPKTSWSWTKTALGCSNEFTRQDKKEASVSASLSCGFFECSQMPYSAENTFNHTHTHNSLFMKLESTIPYIKKGAPRCNENRKKTKNLYFAVAPCNMM